MNLLLKAIPFLLSGLSVLFLYSPNDGGNSNAPDDGTDSLELVAAITVDWMTLNLDLNAKESEIAYFEYLDYLRRKEDAKVEYSGNEEQLAKKLEDLDDWLHTRLKLALTKTQLKEYYASQDEIDAEIQAYFAKHDTAEQ